MLGVLSSTSPLEFNFDLMDSLFSTYLESGAVAPWNMLDAYDEPPTPSTDCHESVLIGIKRSLLESTTLLNLPTDQRLNVQATVDDLLTPSRVQRFLGYYWNSWHRNCRIVHRPSFDSSATYEPLLVAIISVGAM